MGDRASTTSPKMVWNVLLGLLVGGGLLLFVLVRTDGSQVLERLEEVELGPALVAVGASVAGIVLRGLRWRDLLTTLLPIRPLEATAAYSVGNTTNMLAPARVGDLLRARLVAHGRGRTAAVLASIAVERFLDLSILTILLWSASIALRDDRYRMLGVVMSFALTLVFATGAWILTRTRRREEVTQSRSRSRLLRFLMEHGGHFTEGLGSVSADRRSLLLGIAWSCLAWTASMLGVWAALQAVGITVPLAAVILVESLFELAGALPSAPAFIGTIQVAAVGALLPFDVAAEAAVAFSFLYQAAFVSGSILAGAAGLSVILTGFRKTRGGGA